LDDSLPEQDEARPIVAKINDFIRFLHKNQATLLSPTYRRWNESEIKMKQKMLKNEEKKRKRLEEPA
jgi:hypothetical protein